MNLSKLLKQQTLAARGIKDRAYIPVTPTDLVDSDGNTWASAARNTGTYTFRPSDNSSLWVPTARAVHLSVYAVWAAASVTSSLNVRRTSAAATQIQCRALVADIGSDINGNVSLDTSGYFYVVIVGANTGGCRLRLLGYYT